MSLKPVNAMNFTSGEVHEGKDTIPQVDLVICKSTDGEIEVGANLDIDVADVRLSRLAKAPLS